MGILRRVKGFCQLLFFSFLFLFPVMPNCKSRADFLPSQLTVENRKGLPVSVRVVLQTTFEKEDGRGGALDAQRIFMG